MKQTLIFLAVLSLFAIADASTPIPMNLQVAGVERQALVFPPSNSTGKVPLVFAFHGHGGNANGFAVHAGIQNAWPEALVVYPQGLRIPTDVDPQGLKPGWQRRAGEVGDRDLKFVDAMMTKLREQYPVDEQHILPSDFLTAHFLPTCFGRSGLRCLRPLRRSPDCLVTRVIRKFRNQRCKSAVEPTGLCISKMSNTRWPWYAS
jgi:hypothetical protein